jgi:hypothetical protein
MEQAEADESSTDSIAPKPLDEMTVGADDTGGGGVGDGEAMDSVLEGAEIAEGGQIMDAGEITEFSFTQCLSCRWLHYILVSNTPSFKRPTRTAAPQAAALYAHARMLDGESLFQQSHFSK